MWLNSSFGLVAMASTFVEHALEGGSARKIRGISSGLVFSEDLKEKQEGNST